jgi:WD40 repeat protein
VFSDSRRESAREVLRALIDARLLTSFEDEPSDQASAGSRHRVEIVHESLLRAWPRLVRWQTQDADAAQLRDQLRQAARTWDEHERTDDMLWTGSAFREYAVWRERYQGGLSELEEAFAAAMTSLATRRRRRRQIAATVFVAFLTAVAIVLFTLWRRSVHETRRAEATKLLALAQARVIDDPTEALALTTASLEVADTREAREFVMRALWAAPPALELEVETAMERREVSFSPGGRHVAVAGNVPEVRVWADDGQGPIRLGGHLMIPPNIALWADDDLVVTSDVEGGRAWLPFADRTKVWSIPDGTLLRTVELASPAYWKVGPRRLFAQIEHGEGAQRRMELRFLRLPDGPEELLDSLSPTALAGISDLVAAPDGSGWVVTRGRELFFRPFGGGGSERLLEVLDAEAYAVPYGAESVLVEDQTGNLRLWSFGGGEPRRSWAIRRPAAATNSLPDWQGRRVARLSPDRQSIQVWELDGLPGASPLELRRSGRWYDPNFAFHPEGTWCAATTHVEKRLTMWPLARPYPSVLEGFEFPRNRKPLTFSPDSQWLAVGWEEGVRLLPVRGGDPGAVRDLSVPIGASSSDFRFDREGRYLLVVSLGDAWVVPLDGGPARLMVPAVDHRQIEQGAISPSGKRVASAYFIGQGPFELYIVDVATGARRAFDLPWIGDPSEREAGVINLEFLDEETLLTMGGGGLRRWDLATGRQELMVANDGRRWMDASPNAGLAVAWGPGADLAPPVELIDLAAWTSRPLPGFGGDVEWADLDPSGTVVAAGSTDGTIQVARVDGGEPHLLLGHTGSVTQVAISPDLQWLASAGDDNTLRLWPMPDLSKPPLHTLHHDELLAKLHSLTNLRAVRDPAAPTGWTIELGPFPGWRDIPTW